MRVGIVGLGLIGGSMAKAFHAAGRDRVLAFDRDRSMLDFALLSGAVDEALTEEKLPTLDLLLVALYPEAAIAYLESAAPHLRRDALVLDTCGTKRLVCAAGFRLAERYGFAFVGGHPMAGTHFSGFKYAKETLFKGAPMVLVPPRFDDIELLGRVRDALTPLQLGRFSVTTAEDHDRMIAFTSEMPHIVSNAFIKSPTARAHKGFSAGSYKDLTRVAWLNPDMWTELFLENRDCLLSELDVLMESLGQYRAALAAEDAAELRRLLAEGRDIKEEVDGR